MWVDGVHAPLLVLTCTCVDCSRKRYEHLPRQLKSSSNNVDGEIISGDRVLH